MRLTHIPDVRLRSLQGCLVGDDSGADIENRLSSSWSEFDGALIKIRGFSSAPIPIVIPK